jgi:membrane associated rhomboid family serine protease
MFFPFHDDNPVRRTPVATYGLIAINVLAFLWLLRQPDMKELKVVAERGFVPARLTHVDQPGLVPVKIHERLQVNTSTERREVLGTLLTCMFLHGGWVHLIGNMWFLLIFGNNVEDRLGSVPYLLLYLAGGIAGSLCYWFFAPDSVMPVIGASGAVATVLGAYAVTWPWARVHTLVVLIVFITVIPLPAMVVLGFWFVLQLLSAAVDTGGLGGGVACGAHVGGFVVGMVAMPVLRSLFGPSPPPQQVEVWEA